LFIKGQLCEKDTNTLAVVGTRKVTPYGREVTQRLVAGLSRKGLTIVSGLARGVDGITHRTALENGGRTVAVFGSGLDQIYPPEHHELARKISENGALVSEYPPNTTKPSPGNFPARNRIVSGMSLGVLVTEGASKSGSKITAMLALDQNREVFAVPGSITSPMSAGPAELIQLGAKLVIKEADITSELNLSPIGNGENLADPSVQKPEFSDKNHRIIWQFLENGSQHIDDITRYSKLPVSTVTTCLTLMEFKGLVRHLGDGNYMTL
jgi:DNA processing protein